MMEPFDKIIEYLREGRGGTLATIISRVGATPRDAGAKIFIGDDGSIDGTIGGGCVEAEVWQHARSVIRNREAKRLRYAMSGKTVEDDGMICGGTVDLFLEPVTEKHRDIYETIFECHLKGGRAVIFTTIGSSPFRKLLILENGKTFGDLVIPDTLKFQDFICNSSPLVQDGLLIESVLPPAHVYIYGGGHISQHISRMAKAVDFHVTVVDDREYFANRERFPEADEIVVEDFRDVFKETRPRANDYAVIVTRGHKHDAVVLEEVLKNPPRYTGMIGSRRKVKILFDDLRDKGFGDDLLRTVHAPIGIDIGAETPQEISVSIIAELIKIRSDAA
ncbi:MAG: XdhC family protein [Syntrophorhabdaceae bacterium]